MENEDLFDYGLWFSLIEARVLAGAHPKKTTRGYHWTVPLPFTLAFAFALALALNCICLRLSSSNLLYNYNLSLRNGYKTLML